MFVGPKSSPPGNVKVGVFRLRLVDGSVDSEVGGVDGGGDDGVLEFVVLGLLDDGFVEDDASSPAVALLPIGDTVGNFSLGLPLR